MSVARSVILPSRLISTVRRKACRRSSRPIPTGSRPALPNHSLHWDNGIILMAIPLSWRWKLAVAAAADDVFGNKLNGIFSSVLANAFPLAREGAIRRSLELLGARLDRQFSVLIYPEGKLTIGGPMQPFKSGTGLIAVHHGLHDSCFPVTEPQRLDDGNVLQCAGTIQCRATGCQRQFEESGGRQNRLSVHTMIGEIRHAVRGEHLLELLLDTPAKGRAGRWSKSPR